MRQSLLPLLFLAMLLATCSKQPQLVGRWKNGYDETLHFSADSSVILGKEGLQGGDKGTWTLLRDTVRVTTQPALDDLGRFHNVYVFSLKDNSMFMESTTLYRGDDFSTISTRELAKRLRKSEERLAFTKTGD